MRLLSDIIPLSGPLVVGAEAAVIYVSLSFLLDAARVRPWNQKPKDLGFDKSLFHCLPPLVYDARLINMSPVSLRSPQPLQPTPRSLPIPFTRRTYIKPTLPRHIMLAIIFNLRGFEPAT